MRALSKMTRLQRWLCLAIFGSALFTVIILQSGKLNPRKDEHPLSDTVQGGEVLEKVNDLRRWVSTPTEPIHMYGNHTKNTSSIIDQIKSILVLQNSTVMHGKNTQQPNEQTLAHVSVDKEYKCDAMGVKIFKEKISECKPLFDHLRNCLLDPAAGRKPLPNFYLNQDVMDPKANDDYKIANVAFVHIPKAGGTSVEDVLMRIPGLQRPGGVSKTRVAHCNNLYQQGKVLRHNPRQVLFYSKRSFGVHYFAHPGRPFAYVTWLREPIDRLLSTYYYAKKKHCFGVHKICIHYLAHSQNLTDYLSKTENIHFQDMDNFYVRLLQFGNFPDIDATFEDCCGSVELEDAAKIPKIEEKHYLVARENLLTKMSFIGLMDEFQTSQDMMSHIFGIEIEEQVHINANPHKYQISDFEMEELRRRNSWDLKLYEEAKEIFRKQKEAYDKWKANKH